MKLNKRPLFTFIAVLLVLTAGTAFAAYPNRTVTIIVPFNAGGGTDGIARGFADLLGKELGQTVVVKNIAGASGTVGTAQAAKAKADGYTLGFIPIGPLTTQPHLNKLPYDVDSWEYIANVTLSPLVFLVDENAPWKSIKEVAEDGKKNPNKYIYGSSGPGTMPHIAMVATMQALGIKARHVPDKGTGPGMKSLAGGVTQFFADTPPLLERYAVKGLGVYSDKRLPSYPDMPTMQEQGVDLKFSVWRGIVAPKGIPEEALKSISVASEKVCNSQEFKDFIVNVKGNIKYMDAKDFGAFVRAEYKKNGDILKAAGLKK
jgi:tripartite-type tricarboxylate transporter receptor subunit TctC